MTLKLKPYIETIIPYEPGKPIEEVKRELGLARVVKLASNENPLGTSPKAVQAIRHFAAQVALYPDGGTYQLGKTLAQSLGVQPTQLILGNGSNEIIELLVKGFVDCGDEVLSSETSFLVYPLVTQTAGATFRTVPMQEMRYDLEALAHAITERTRVVFIANPNNPTGTYVTRQEVGHFLRRVPQEVLVCFDEAYVDFVDADDFPRSLDLLTQDNVIVLRTFSKSYGLAGLRLGCGIAQAPLIQYLHKIRQPFNVNAMAQVAGCAALADRAFLKRTVEVVAAGRRYLYQELTRLGLTYWKSQANFILIDTKLPGYKVVDALLHKGVIIRGMQAYQLPTCIRVTIGLPKENQLFIQELEQALLSSRGKPRNDKKQRSKR